MSDDHRAALEPPSSTAPATTLAELMEVVGALSVAAEQSALLRGALATGFLARCARPVSVAVLSDATGIDQARVLDLCAALQALGALVVDDQGLRAVSRTYAPLLDGGVDVLVERRLAGDAVRGSLLEGSFTQSPDYWGVDAESRRALAASVTVDPATPMARAVLGASIEGVAPWHEAFSASTGARYLELGCGLAGGLLTYLQLYPGVTAVGVDLAGDLLDVARSQAVALHVADRVRFVEGDAADLSDAEGFDVVFWSQFFFARRTRQATLRNAFARLRAGGLLVAPVLATGTEGARLPGHPADVQASLNALLLRSWDVPVLSASELAAELTGAGFTGAGEHPGPFAAVVVAHRP